MKSFLRLLAALLIVATTGLPLSAQQPGIVVGRVQDSVQNDVLRHATIRVEGTRRGAVANDDGRYIIRIEPGTYTLAASMVGYRVERRSVTVRPGDTVTVDFTLGLAPRTGAAVTVYSEDPGVSLMRRVIRRVERQRDSLRSYRYTLYTRFVAASDTTTAGRATSASDTTIISIFESYSRGYFEQPDHYFNEIIQRRQTANIPPEGNVVAFGTNLNAYDPTVELLGEEIFTPFHASALDWYDFRLQGYLRVDSAVTLARVEVEPKGDGRRLFRGFVDIDTATFAPQEVEFRPNRAVRLPFDASLVYRQTFAEQEGGYVMPAGMTIEGSASASILWIINPRVDLSVRTVAFDYHINEDLDGELFEQRRVEVAESAETFDTLFWSANPIVPLRPQEEVAYEEIRTSIEAPDSLDGSNWITRTLGDVPRLIGRLNRRPFTGLEDVVRHNRVHGTYGGLGLEGEPLDRIEVLGRLGYGFGNNRAYGELSSRVWLDSTRHIAVSGGVYHRLQRTDNPWLISAAGVTLLSLLNGSDYGDYYDVLGAEGGVEFGIGQLRFARRDRYVRPSTVRLLMRSEEHANAPVTSRWSLLGNPANVRDNPPVMPGTLRSLGFELNLNYTPERRLGDIGFQLRGEMSEPTVLPSDFDYRQLGAVFLWRTPTLPLWKLDLRLAGGWSFGRVPPQRFFSLESAVSAIAGGGSFRGMRVKEFYGDRYASISLEHNFGEIIPGVLRIPNIASFGIEFLALGRAGWSTFSPEARDYTGTLLASTDATEDRLYYELGLGLNRILLFFRFDITARLTQTDGPRFFLTFTSATN